MTVKKNAKTTAKTTARTTAKNEHKKANYDRLEIVLPLGWKDRIKEISSEMCGFDSKTYEQLLRWQVSKGYFKDIAGVGDHQIIFKNGDVWNFKSVAELRYMWKASREGH